MTVEYTNPDSTVTIVTDTVRYTVKEFNAEWTVVRKSSDYRATATSTVGTIADLAMGIGLDADEFEHWLTFTTSTATTIMLADNSTIFTSELTTSHILAPGQEFEVPNTIYMAWFGEGGNSGRGFMTWDQNAQNLAYLGFKVVPFDNDWYPKHAATAAKWDFVRNLEILAENKSVHGLYMIGHGSSGDVGSESRYETLQNVTVVGPLWSVDYIDTTIYNVIDPQTPLGPLESSWSIAAALNYHLGAIIIQACYSNGSDAELLVSSNGFFSGKTGKYYPMGDHHAKHKCDFQPEGLLGGALFQ